MVRALVERYWAAQDPYDPASLARLRHRTWTADWPQSGERIPSHDADVAIHSAYEGYPAHRLDRLGGADEIWRSLPTAIVSVPVRISGASDIWIAEVSLVYPGDGAWLAVMLIELAGGLIGRETVYYCRASGDAARADQTPPMSASMEHDADVESRHAATYADYAERAVADPDSAVRALFHEDALFDRPQSGVRASGRPAIARSHREMAPLLPAQTRRVVASGDVLVADYRPGPSAGSSFVIRILEFQGDEVARASEYLAEPYEPPEARKAWIERLDEGG